MRKVWAMVLLVLTIVTFSGCRQTGVTQINLSFDENSAYFIAQKKLSPIAGDVLTADDIYERATVNIKSVPAAKFRVTLAYAENQTDIEGLMIRINETTYSFENNIVLYEAAEQSEGVSLDVCIYLGKDTPETSGGCSIQFYFVLYAEA